MYIFKLIIIIILLKIFLKILYTEHFEINHKITNFNLKNKKSIFKLAKPFYKLTKLDSNYNIYNKLHKNIKKNKRTRNMMNKS